MASGYRLEQLAAEVGGQVKGDPQKVLHGIATLKRAAADQLSFLTHPKYRKQAEQSSAGALLVAPDSGIDDRDLLEVAHPYLALAQLLPLFHPEPKTEPTVSAQAQIGSDVSLGQRVDVAPFAVLGDGVTVGDDVRIGAGSVIGTGCRIGPGTILYPRVVLYAGIELGARCVIHAGVVIGADGFGFATHEGTHHKIPQVGRVIVEDDVEIGANSTVDRGALDDTRIGAGTKIDDLVMVAHGVVLGRGCLLAAQAGIAGSTRIGDHVIFAGQSGASGHLDIGSGAVVAAKTAVFNDVANKSYVAGVPATDHREWKRSLASVKRLPDLRRELRQMRARIAELERRLETDESGDD